MNQIKTPQYLKLDERNHVEKPFLDQLDGLGWEIIDLDSKQHPSDSFRQSFTEVMMLPVLREQLKVINDWMEDDQVEEVVKQLTAGFPGTGLIQNNRHVFTLLLENTSVSENRRTGEKSPTVYFVDFTHRKNNRFISVCQPKIRILGTEHHIVPDIVLFLNGLPVVVIECKSPKVKDAIPEAIDQMLRYSEQRGAKGEGSAPLFYYSQIVIATCRQEAKFGTITTHSEKYFYRWADPYPRTVDDLDHGESGPNDQQRLEILGYGSREAYLEAHPTIAAKAKDMVAHYLTHVFPNGYKAQVVATSREAAVRYKKHIDDALAAAISDLEQANPRKLNLERLRDLTTDVIISGNNNDLPHLKVYSDSARHEASIKSFKLAFGNEEEGVTGKMGILIVNNMLITGFDAPVEQVMYLDKVIVAHNLLQAIARVNRVGGESKDKGFVVDYVGIGHHLKKAIDAYDEREQKEVLDSLSFPEEELQELRASHAAVMDLLRKHGLTDLADHDAFFDLFYDEDLRFDYLLAFKQLTKCLNLVFPARQALDYMADYQALTEINVLAGKHLRDERLSMKGIPPKLRGITDAYLESKGIEVKIEPISILDEDFQKQVGKRGRTKTKAAEVEHAIRHHLDIELDDDPDLQASFAQALAKIFEEFRNNWNRIYLELEKLRTRIIHAGQEPTYGLHRKKQMPLFRMFAREIFEGSKTATTLDPFVLANAQMPYVKDKEEQISQLVDLTQKAFLAVERELRLTGFWESIPARNKLKADLQKILLAPEFIKLPGLVANRVQIISRIMEIAEKNNDIILYAA
jgi:type I site-specific restriction-modification system R (restriction) subunit